MIGITPGLVIGYACIKAIVKTMAVVGCLMLLGAVAATFILIGLGLA